jgi:hypothetical protein
MTSITHKLASLLCVLFVTIALGCASTAKPESTGEYVDDTVITGKVKAAIFNERTLKSAEINVETFKGVVQLSGFVSSAANESRAARVARNIGGVSPSERHAFEVRQDSSRVPGRFVTTCASGEGAIRGQDS